MTERELTDWIRFCHFEILPEKANELLEYFHYDIGELLKSETYLSGQFEQNAGRQLERYNYWKNKDLSEDLKFISDNDVQVIPCVSDKYPRKLKNIYDPPPVIFAKGTAEFNTDAPVLSVVGSRKADYYGLSVAETISRDLSRNGFIIVSGGARGIDSAAHRGSLAGGGVTWSVFGCGVCVDYPKENSLLFMDIAASGGALVSEYLPRSDIAKFRFPMRNRIIAGLCDAILVIQAPAQSGALITAGYGREYGSDVFAVPGNVDDDRNSGTNALIKDGCALIETADDVAFNMGYTVLEATVPGGERVPALEPGEQRIFDLITTKPVNTEYIMQQTGLPVTEVNIALTYLELKGVIKRVPGNCFVRSVLS
ncbi:MAG: DNA-processing protein DprA [Abditibacteriota bacterium]|nr:DNA-processing protein DprA [Abditibacteriota bacterium]